MKDEDSNKFSYLNVFYAFAVRTLHSRPPLSSHPGLSKGVASQGMAQFQEMMRQQLESSMHAELEKLLDTTTGAEREVRASLPPRLSDHLVAISEGADVTAVLGNRKRDAH